MNSEHQLVTAYQDLSPKEQKKRLWELAQVFLRLGITAFGGPAAHIALMEHEIVQRRQWLTREELLDLLGITYLIPGPNSTELAIHQALMKLGPKAIKNRLTLGAAIAAVAGYGLGWSEIMLLIALGISVMVMEKGLSKRQNFGLFLLPGMPLLSQTPSAQVGHSLNGLTIFLLFLKIGSVLYGSGYVLLAFLQRELVDKHQWLTSQQLLDAVAIGQFTPGPVFTTATFVGYLLADNVGAIAGTVGIFLPAFLLVGFVHPWVDKLRQSAWIRGFLDGVNAASLGLMVGVTITLAQAALVDYFTIFITLLSGLILWRFSLNSAWLVLGGAALGWLVKLYF